MDPRGPFRAYAWTTITLTYTVGPAGLDAGGSVKFALPNNGWTEPLTPYPRGAPELYRGDRRQLVGWARCNTTLHVESKGAPQMYLSHRNSQNIVGKHDNWTWWITALLEDGRLAEGDRIVVTYGDTSLGEEGAQVQGWVENNRVYFSAFVDSKGSGGYLEVAGSPVECAVVSGEAQRCMLTIPSITRPNTPFSAKVTSTDGGHNPVPDPTVDTIRILDDQDRDRYSGPDLPGRVLKIAEGMTTEAHTRYRIEIACNGRDITGTSNPTLCRPEGPNLYWGDLHCHSFYHMYNPDLGYGHPCTKPAELIEYARDVSHLDFVACTDGRGALPDNAGWQESQQAVRDGYREGAFVTLKGWEIQFGQDGHRNAIYRQADSEPHIDAPEFLDASVWSSAGAKGMCNALEYYRGRKDVMLIPHHVMAWMNWDVYDPELDRLVEIYSCWGSSESRHNELWSKASPERKSVRHALSRGYKLGFVGGSDSHTGYVGRSIPDGDRYTFVRYKAGFTAVWCDCLSRESLFDALRNRSCYATTGARIIVEFWVDDLFMGGQASGNRKPDSHTIRFSIRGTDIIRRVEVIRDGEIAFSSTPNQEIVSDEWCDRSDKARTARYYYLKIVQMDGNTAWASPVWVYCRR